MVAKHPRTSGQSLVNGSKARGVMYNVYICPDAVVADLRSVYKTISLFLIATKCSFQFGLVLHVVVKHPKASLDQRQSFVNGSRPR